MADQITLVFENHMLVGGLSVDDGGVVTWGDPDTGFPMSRLYDGMKGLLTKWTNGPDTIEFILSLGGAWSGTTNFMAAQGHNFENQSVQGAYSGNGADWTIIETKNPTDGSDLIWDTTDQSHSYWRIYVTSAMDNPALGEWFVGYGIDYNVQVAPQAGKGFLSNVSWLRSIGESERALLHGSDRKTFNYTLYLSASDLTTFETQLATMNSFSQPFWLKDHLGNYYHVRFNSLPSIRYDDNGYAIIALDIIEVI